jgi:hypothetical protein
VSQDTVPRFVKPQVAGRLTWLRNQELLIRSRGVL